MASRDDRPFRPARHRITSSREHSDLYALAEKGCCHSLRFQASTAVSLSDRVGTCAFVWNFFMFRMFHFSKRSMPFPSVWNVTSLCSQLSDTQSAGLNLHRPPAHPTLHCSLLIFRLPLSQTAVSSTCYRSCSSWPSPFFNIMAQLRYKITSGIDLATPSLYTIMTPHQLRGVYY